MGQDKTAIPEIEDISLRGIKKNTITGGNKMHINTQLKESGKKSNVCAHKPAFIIPNCNLCFTYINTHNLEGKNA